MCIDITIIYKKSINLFILLILIFVNSLYGQESLCFYQRTSNNILSVLLYDKNNQKDTTNKTIKKTVSYKNPLIATGLAIIPGFVARGIGHLYAGRPKTALTIFIISYLGLYGAAGGHTLSFQTTSFMVYLGSWFYDILVSPIHCMNDNNKKNKSISVTPYFKSELMGHQTGIRLLYQF